MIGLVLAGGGARGAYQVGVVRYLAERGFCPDLIAGTSIGALNGAVLAAGTDFNVGTRNLEALWHELGSIEVIRARSRPTDTSLGLLFDYLELFLPRDADGHFSFLDPSPVEELLRRFVRLDAIRSGIPIWVTVARVLRIAPFTNAILDAVVAAQTADAVWIRLNTLRTLTDLHQFLLASAAIPFAFPARRIGGNKYVDGGLRDNVPLRALANAGCTRAVVVHLSNGSAWRRQRFAGIDVLEIRPRLPIQLNSTPGIGWIRSLLDFRASTIAELIARGAADARAIVDDYDRTLGAVRARKRSEREMLGRVARLKEED